MYGIEETPNKTHKETLIESLELNSFYACKINESFHEEESRPEGLFKIIAVTQTTIAGMTKGRIILGFPNCGEIPVLRAKGCQGYILYFKKEFLRLNFKNIHLVNTIRGELDFTGARADRGIFQVDTDVSVAMDVINILRTFLIGQKLNDPSNFKTIAASSINAIMVMALEQRKKSQPALLVCNDSSQRLQQCLDYIEKNYMKEITAQELAKMAMMSETGFRKLFSDTIGVPLKKYISKIRINKAISFLDCEEASLKDIAARVGYRDMSTFYRNFHKETKMTPIQYCTSLRTI